MTDQEIVCWIPGQPSRVTHQSGTRIGRHGTYKTKALREWETKLAQSLANDVPDQPIDGPVRLEVCFVFKPRRRKDDGTWKVTRPDTDNLIKTVKDVMTHLGFWKDDSQVVWESSKKTWGFEPGISIVVTAFDASNGKYLAAMSNGFPR